MPGRISLIQLSFSHYSLLIIFHLLKSNKELEEQRKDEENEGRSFSPVAISSPYCQSFEDYVCEDDHYQQSPFNVSNSTLSLNFANQPFSDTESTFDDLLENKDYSSWMRIRPLHNQTMSDVRIVIENDDDNSCHLKVLPQYNSSEDTGYQSSTNNTVINSHSKLKNKKIFLRDHIFTRESFQGFHCNQFCCTTYIDKLFVEMTEEEIVNTDTLDHHKNVKNIKEEHVKSNKLLFQNKKISDYSKKRNKQTRDSFKSSTTQNGHRTQTPHMRGYIALRQQCRLNEDLSPLTKSKSITPKLNSSIEIGGIRKSKLKRKKTFKVNNETDHIGRARRSVSKRCESDSFLSTSSSFESLTNLSD